MAGGSSDQSNLNTAFAKANAADDAAAQDTRTADASAAAVPPITYRASADKATPVPQYYNQMSRLPSAPAQSATLNIPGFQGVANPFYTPGIPASHQASADQAAHLLGQYNTYRQGYADQLNASRAADQARLDAQMKAYADAQAAKKAEADAAAAKAQQQSFLFGGGGDSSGSMPAGYLGGGASGGIADLQKGFQR